MSLEVIKQALLESNLKFNQNAPFEIMEFLNSYGISLNFNNSYIQVMCAAGILSQIKLQKADNEERQNIDEIKIETILQSLSGYQKIRIMQVISSMVPKNQAIFNKLQQKINKIIRDKNQDQKINTHFQQIQNTINQQVNGTIEQQKQKRLPFQQNNYQNQNLPFQNATSIKLNHQLKDINSYSEKRQTPGSSLNSNRIVNLEFVRTCLDFVNNQQAMQLYKKIFAFNQQNISQIQYQNISKAKIHKIIDDFQIKCINKQKRVSQTFSFFKYFIIKIFQHHNTVSNTKMFREIKTFNAVLCITSDLFNFAYSSLITSYRKQCEYFQVPLIQALIPVNWIGKNIQKPVQINLYLYSLQKRVLINEIWEDETGYNLIKSQLQFKQSSQIGYNDLVVWNRLQKHVYDRIQELSKQVKLQYKLIKRVQSLIQVILKEKPFLLQKNKIDQIIICCMTSFLSLNELDANKNLEGVFQDYRRLDMSYSQNRQSVIQNGKEMTLSEFYNQIFLPEIKDIVNTSDILLTPIRIRNSLVSNSAQKLQIQQKDKKSNGKQNDNQKKQSPQKQIHQL